MPRICHTTIGSESLWSRQSLFVQLPPVGDFLDLALEHLSPSCYSRRHGVESEPSWSLWRRCSCASFVAAASSSVFASSTASLTSGSLLYSYLNSTLARYQLVSVDLASGVLTAVTVPPADSNDM